MRNSEQIFLIKYWRRQLKSGKHLTSSCSSLFNDYNEYACISLSRLAIVKREKARKVEDQLIQSATTGKLASKVSCLLYGLY
jgi:hypothetical protein